MTGIGCSTFSKPFERIRRHTADGRGRFDTDELVQNWVVRHLEIVGEAASRLSDETREAMPDVPWRAIVGMRNVLVHGYFDIDRDAIWGVVDRDLDPLETSLWRHLGWEEAPTTEQRRSSGGEDAAAPFHRDMVAGIATLKRELSYNPTRFAQMLGGYGGVGAAKRLLSSHEYSEGFTTLWEHRRLDLSVEAFVLLPWYRELFNGTSAPRRNVACASTASTSKGSFSESAPIHRIGRPEETGVVGLGQARLLGRGCRRRSLVTGAGKSRPAGSR